MSDTNPADDTAGVDPATLAEEEVEATSAHDADRPPTADEEARADALTLDPSVAEHYDEMNEIGANVKGEGEVP